MSANNITFILHKPQLSENIGACARGMKNFNFQKLSVIDPRPIFPNDKILATSVGAKNIINKSKVFDHLEPALKNIDYVIASARTPPPAALRLSCHSRSCWRLRSADDTSTFSRNSAGFAQGPKPAYAQQAEGTGHGNK